MWPCPTRGRSPLGRGGPPSDPGSYTGLGVGDGAALRYQLAGAGPAGLSLAGLGGRFQSLACFFVDVMESAAMVGHPPLKVLDGAGLVLAPKQSVYRQLGTLAKQEFEGGESGGVVHGGVVSKQQLWQEAGSLDTVRNRSKRVRLNRTLWLRLQVSIVLFYW